MIPHGTTQENNIEPQITLKGMKKTIYKIKTEQINLLFEELLITQAITPELRVLYRRQLNAILSEIESEG